MDMEFRNHLPSSRASDLQVKTFQGPPSEGFPTTMFFVLLGLYFGLHVVLRLVASPALELDEAEQVVHTQWLLPGYGPEPPLYTWLQILFIKIFGLNILALSLLKNPLLFSSYIFLFLGARIITRNESLAAIAALSLLFIPQISWGAQRDLTNSVLLIASCSAFFYTSIRLVEKQTLLNYFLLGLALGAGLLSKHNFSLFVAALIISFISSAQGQKAMCKPHILLTALVAAFMVSPYVLWAVSHIDPATSSLHKLHFQGWSATPAALVKLTVSLASALVPVILVYALFFPQIFRQSPQSTPTEHYSISLRRFFLLLIAFLLIMAVFFHVTKWKSRWLAPLFILLPVWFVNRMTWRELTKRRMVSFIKISALVSMVILVVMGLRTLASRYTGFVSDLNYPSSAVATAIKKLGFSRGIIVTDRQVIAGDMRIQFPQTLVLCPSLRGVPYQPTVKKVDVVALWQAEGKRSIPGALRRYLKETLNVLPDNATPIYKKFPLYRFPQRYITVGIALIGPQNRTHTARN